MKKRILLKISGESLMGKSNYGIDVSTINKISDEIKKVYKKKYIINWKQYARNHLIMSKSEGVETAKNFPVFDDAVL